MPLSTYATTIGTICLLFGIPMLMAPKQTTAWILRMMDDDPLIRIVGALFLTISLLVLQDDYTVGTDPAGLVRLIAWATGIKSLIMCWWPQWLCTISRRMLSIPVMQGFKAVGSLAFGVLLLWAGAVL